MDNYIFSPIAAGFIVLLAVAWTSQLILSFFQAKRFYSRLSQLRRQGKRTSIGLAGSNWRTKAYGVLVVDEKNQIVCAEKLTGWTVFAGLQPVKPLIGLPLEALSGERIQGISKKSWLAFQKAAEQLVTQSPQTSLFEQGPVKVADA